MHKEVVRPLSKAIYQPIPRIYPKLPPVDDDGFDYFDTPTKPNPGRGQPQAEPMDLDDYDWEDSEDEFLFKKQEPYHAGDKRPAGLMGGKTLSPPSSPPPRKKTLADPFTTPPKQVTATPHTPPDTKALKSPHITLTPLSYVLLNELSPHAKTLGQRTWQNLKDHLLKCGRVADGAVKGRDVARVAIKKGEDRIEELETRVRVLEAEREVDRAVIGALKRNVDVLTGKVKRTD
jgi:hypothetical protein